MEEERVPTVTLPERLEPRRRFGPFPSATDALKFLLAAALGALVALRFGLLWWTPFLGGGFLLGAYRKEGRTLDERVGGFAQWRLRRARPIAAEARGGPEGEGTQTLRSGQVVAALATDGIPIAYLPGSEARRLFDAYRELLRATDGSFTVNVARVPVRSRTYLPTARVPRERADHAASLAYAEMLRLVTRRRTVRRVALVFFAGEGDRGRAALERTIGRWTVGLGGIGLTPQRLRGEAIARARAGAPGSA